MMTDTNGGRSGRSVAVLGARWAGNALATICALVLAFAMCVAGLVAVPSAVADEAATTVDETGSITVDYENGDTPIGNATVKLYHVGNWDSSGNFESVYPFNKYNITWKQADADAYRDLAETIRGYISTDNIPADATRTTNASGVATFDGLAKGLYLVVIESYSDGDFSCKPSALLVSIPSATGENGKTTMNPTIYPKTSCETTPPTPPTETVKKKVVKVWKGDSSTSRPGKVIVQLLQDGKAIDEVELNASNNWTHEWTNLPAGHEYQAVEKTVPDNYTVLVDRENDVITITNTYTPPTPPTPPGGHNPPSDNTPPSKKTPPIGETGSNVVIAAICAGVLGGLGVILLVHRKRKAK
ncbi:Cna B-type domain-containing protein [Bifidobacterium callitrichidarum]|uniref:CNA-B domain-containing protein n=1 Tax=Bifidobacterium callitrichidarum TaxID=2052941 RepID=A0A2U2N5Q7_9BIFI|nr:Cna B-type domain-containing protein [Bifidobacterium callitrichidarum]PWG64417.1 hypothetical protein DF196_09035 [Bifidobacterium callitrichidarum]